MTQRWVSEFWGRHEGEDVFVVGTGTSLTGFDWGRLKGRVTVGLNNAALFHPVTYHLWSDHPLWKRYERLVEPPETLAVAIQNGSVSDLLRSPHCGYKDRIVVWRRHHDLKDISKIDVNLWTSHTVATAGIMLAWKLGARRIFLLGVDAYNTPHATYCDGTRQDVRKVISADRERVVEGKHLEWIKEMNDLRESLFVRHGVYREPFPGSGVFNLSAKSGITAWEKVDVDVALSR